MVILRNIKLNNTGIECDYNPEKSDKWGHIALDRNGNENIRFSDYEYGKQTYAAMTVNKLKHLLETGDIPERTIITWY